MRAHRGKEQKRNDSDNFTAKLSKELKAGVLSVLILNLIKKEKNPVYGYSIIKSLKEMSREKLNIQEGTFYPVLRMLENQGLLKSQWKNSPDGPPRKYYTLTDKGKEAAEGAIEQWLEISTTVEDILETIRGGKE